MNIGVFDSGVGGKSVANALGKAFPEHTIIFKNDSTHVPYGERPPQQLLQLVTPIISELVAENCEVIVIACNTVSTTIINELRERFDVPLVGLEPLIKSAIEMTKSKVIAVCATPITLQSQRYQALKNTYAQDVEVIEPDCSDWSLLIEEQMMEEHHIADRLESVLVSGVDVIVLGCTHYHWIEEEITSISAGRAIIIQPEPFVIEEVRQVLEQLK